MPAWDSLGWNGMGRSMVWYGVVWCDVIWYDEVGYDVIPYDLMRYPVLRRYHGRGVGVVSGEVAVEEEQPVAVRSALGAGNHKL